ncbi:MAG TPA: glycosyltransferase family 39 protein [Chitinophagales bacterium]|nr:glycosyltransferase family 39 protein [Chitinophagales bacterium]
MPINKKNILIAFFGVIGFAFMINTINADFVKNASFLAENERLVHGQTIYSIDNSFYLPQIKNWLAGHGFTCDASDKKYLVRRTPVYPMFYGVHYLLFGEKNSFFFIKISQTILFALSAVLFLLAVNNLTSNKKMAWLAFLLYGFNPTLISNTYFTLTESISPALVVLTLYFFSKAMRNSKLRDWLTTGIFFSIASLCRPPIFFFGGAVAIAILLLYYKNKTSLLKTTFAFGVGVLLVFTPYVIRNYKVTNGEFILLEKYYGDPMTYGLQNIELRKWISTWTNPADYSAESVSNKMWQQILSKRDKQTLIDSMLIALPKAAFTHYSKNTVASIYNCVYDFYAYKFTSPTKKDLAIAEQNAVLFIKKINDKHIAQHPFSYYVIMPMKMMKSIIFQSNAGTLYFLYDYKNNYLFFVIKAILLLLNILLFISLIGNILFIKKHLIIYIAILFFVSINCFYMLFVINYFEARYLVPMFPFLYISGAIFAVEMYEFMKKKITLLNNA